MSGPRKRADSAPTIMSTALPTTFVTKEQGRPPSTYQVDHSTAVSGMMSQRARQEHPNGPKVMQRLETVHAFTETVKQQESVANNVDKLVATGKNVSEAMRMEIMDGHAKARAKFGAQHLESFTNIPNSESNPHISGGTVAFAQQGSPLSNFTNVSEQVQDNRNLLEPQRTYTTQGLTGQQTPEVQRFNQSALSAQKTFAKSILNAPIPDE